MVSLFAIVYVHRDTFASLMYMWAKSDTYAHGFLIAPIVVYMIYQQRAAIACLPKTVSWVGLIGLLLAGVLWGIGAITDALVVQQLGFVAMIPAVSLVIMGYQVTWHIAFALGFLFLAVPFGDSLTPALIDHTADFVVSALRWSQIPVYREGNTFVIPSGRWSVVTACSGLRYLMATVTVAALFAYLNYVSVYRRVLFIAVAILIAIFANWLRAYGIVMLGHLSNNRLAVGVDHLIYGWIFFGIIIFLLMMVGRIWEEPPAKANAGSSNRVADQAARSDSMLKLTAAFCACVLVINLWPALVPLAESDPVHDRTPSLDAAALPPQWQVSDTALSTWEPEYYGATDILRNTILMGKDNFGVFIAWYANQRQGAEVVNGKNSLIREKNRLWRLDRLGEHKLDRHQTNKLNSVNENLIVSIERTFLVWKWYWHDGRTTTSKKVAKLHQLFSQLSGKGSAGAEIVVYSDVPDEDLDAARERLAAFLEIVNPAISNALSDVSD